jgi:hypothetical protein
VVLEFILDTGEGNTDIQRYKRTHEKVVADRFEGFFEELTQLFAENGKPPDAEAIQAVSPPSPTAHFPAAAPMQADGRNG